MLNAKPQTRPRSLSERRRSSRPDVSLALAFEAYRAAPRVEASSAVIRALLAARRSPLRGVLTTNDRPNTVAFSPDGKMLATGARDHTVRLWDPATRKQLGNLTGHTNDVIAVAFSPDGKTLASAGNDKPVRLWGDVLWRTAAELHATVCDILLTGLTRSTWEQYAPGIPYRRSCP